MSVNIGDARIEITADLNTLEQSLNQAFNVMKENIDRMQNSLSNAFKAVNPNQIEDGFREMGNAIQNAGTEATQFGNAGSKALEQFGKLEIVTQSIDMMKQAFSSAKDYFMDFINEAGGGEIMIEKLRGGLERMGDGDYFEKLTKQAGELQKITPFSDDEIMNGQAMLTTFQVSGEAIEKLTPAMLNLSSAYADNTGKGMDLTQVAIMLGKGYGADLVTAMQKAGVIFTENQKLMLESAEGMDKINIFLDVMASNGNISAEALGKTLPGGIKITKQAIDEWKESIGNSMRPAFELIKSAVQNTVDIIAKLPEGMQLVMVGIGGIGVAVTAVIPIFVAFDAATGGIVLAIGAAVTALAGISVAVMANLDSIKSWVTGMVGGEEGMKKIKDVAKELYEGLSNLWSFILDEFSSAWQYISGVFTDFVKTVSNSISVGGDLTASLKSIAQHGFENLKSMIHTVVESFKLLFTAFTNAIGHNSNLRGALADGSGWSKFQTFVDVSTKILEVFIETAARAGSAIMNIFSALDALRKIRLVDLILNPDAFAGSIKQLESALTGVKDAFTKSFKESIKSTYEVSSTNDFARVGTLSKETTKPPGDTAPKKRGDKSGSDKSSDDKQLDALLKSYDDLLKKMNDEIILGDKTIDQRSELLNNIREELNIAAGIYTKKEDQDKIENKIIQTRLEEQKTLKEIEKKQEDINKVVSEVDDFIALREAKMRIGLEKEVAEITKAYKKKDEDVEKSEADTAQKQLLHLKLQEEKSKELAAAHATWEKNLDDELSKAHNSRIGDEYQIKLKAINDLYDKEVTRIKGSYEEGVKRDELLTELRIKHDKEVTGLLTKNEQGLVDLMTGGFQAAISSIKSSFINAWEGIFGAANSLFGIFIENVAQRLLELAANSVFQSIINLVMGSASGGIFGIIGGLFGSGGDTGDGPEDEIAGLVHKKEYVINAAGTAYPGNKALAGLMNKGVDVGNIFAKMQNDISMPDFSNMNFSPAGMTRSNNINVNFGDITANLQSLQLSDSDMSSLIDNELIPQISKGLHRIGKTALDNTIK